MKYIISDTHLGHHKILEFEPDRLQFCKDMEEHDQVILDNWNSVVTPKDTVYHLGDVFFRIESNRT